MVFYLSKLNYMVQDILQKFGVPRLLLQILVLSTDIVCYKLKVDIDLISQRRAKVQLRF